MHKVLLQTVLIMGREWGNFQLEAGCLTTGEGERTRGISRCHHSLSSVKRGFLFYLSRLFFLFLLPFPLFLQFSAPPGLVSAFLVSSVPVNRKPMFSQFKYLQLTSTTRTGLVKAWNNCRHSMIIGFFVCVLDTNFQVKENNTIVKKW